MTPGELNLLVDELLEDVRMELPHKAHREGFAIYLFGLLSDAERKSIEPIAALSSPDHTDAAHARLVRFNTSGAWLDPPVRSAALAFQLRQVRQVQQSVRGVVLDDTGMIKQGKHSVGVQRQYTGSAGKIANCQVVVTLALVTEQLAFALDACLYLPESWSSDPVRRFEAGVPDDVAFQTKPQIALARLRAAHAAGIALGEYALADADYGKCPTFRAGLTALGLRYGVGVHSSQRVWDAGGIFVKPLSVREIADAIPDKDFRRTSWRVDSNGKKLSARFVLRKVRVTEEGREPTRTDRLQWLVIEWRDGESRAAHFSLCTFPLDWSRKRVIRLLKERWRIERMHEDLKGEVGFDHYEGRGWTGWHHHVTVVLCAYAILVAQRLQAFSPSGAAEDHDGPQRRAA